MRAVGATAMWLADRLRGRTRKDGVGVVLARPAVQGPKASSGNQVTASKEWLEQLKPSVRSPTQQIKGSESRTCGL